MCFWSSCSNLWLGKRVGREVIISLPIYTTYWASAGDASKQAMQPFCRSKESYEGIVTDE